MSGAMARPSPARTRSESRQRTALVALRLLPNERDKLAEAAHSRGMTLSEFIRSSALQAVHTQLKPDTRETDAPGSRDVVIGKAGGSPADRSAAPDCCPSGYRDLAPYSLSK
jgi:hypothetical protein